MIIPGMRDVEAADLESMGALMPEGWYVATIVEANDVVSPNGNPYVGFVFQIANGPQAGRKLNDNVFFTSKSLPIAKAKLSALAYDTSSERQFNPGDFIGRGVSIKVEHEEGRSRDGLPRTWATVTVWKKVGDAPAAAPTGQPGVDEDIPF
jgi:hypothetical protein